MLRAACFLLALVLAPSLALAQTNPNEPRIIVVPVPGENVPDAGQPVAAPPPTPPPEPIIEAPPPQPPPPQPPPPTPPPGNQTIQAQPGDAPQNPPPLEPTVPVDPNLDPASISAPPSAMLDGHPREGSFLSGPGSITFLMHHTIMGSFGLLSTQMIPRIAADIKDKQLRPQCITNKPTDCYDSTGPDARIAYLVGGLLGAGLGFTSAAFWQFYNWMNISTATFGIVNSVIGAAFGIGLSNAITSDTTAISWTGFIGALAGAWLTAIVAGGDMAWNKGIFITSGGAWAAIYTALILGMVASTGGQVNLQGGFDALLIMPALGAAALAIAGLKFHPSSEQILRADFFGAGVGLVVYLISSLLVPGGFIPSATVPAFRSAVPYVLTAVGAAGAKVIVSLLWADTVTVPPATAGSGGNPYYRDPALDKPYSRVWW